MGGESLTLAKETTTQRRRERASILSSRSGALCEASSLHPTQSRNYWRAGRAVREQRSEAPLDDLLSSGGWSYNTPLALRPSSSSPSSQSRSLLDPRIAVLVLGDRERVHLVEQVVDSDLGEVVVVVVAAALEVRVAVLVAHRVGLGLGGVRVLE